MEKLKVYNLTINSSTISDRSLQNLTEIIINEFEELDIGHSSEIKIGCTDMTKEDYENLPEFIYNYFC